MYHVRTSESKEKRLGFTLVEMLVVAPIVILAIGAFLTVIISMTGEVVASRASNLMTYNINDALNRIEQDVKQSSTFLAANNVTLVAGNAQGVNDDTTGFTNVGGTSGTSLILNMIATTGNPIDSASQYIYLKDQPNACATPYDNIPLTYNIVYFVKNSTLWRRVIMPNLYANTTTYSCATPWQQPSCSPTYMSAQSGTVFCKTNDIKLFEGIEIADLNIAYYNGSNATSPNTTASNLGATTTERNQAMNSATTVTVELDATQNAGGREISSSGNIRVSRLSANASALASLTPATTPVAPTIATRTDPGAKAVFSWNAVSGATGYNVDYNINGGAWVTGATNQSARTYTVTAPANGSTVNVRIQATNSAGTSGYGTATVAIPLWEPLLLTNGWVPFPGFTTPSYSKTSSGAVIVKGFMKRSTALVAGQAFATLPTGFRPEGGNIMFGTTTNNATGRVDVNSTGQLVTQAGSNVSFSLDAIRFVPAGTYTRTTMTPLSNGWTNFGGTWAVPSYVQTSNGRVFTQGLIVPGTTTNDTPIAATPAAQLPPQYMQIASRSTIFTSIGFNGTTGLVAKGSGTSYVSLTADYINTGTTGWNNATLQNSWVWSGAPYSTVQYIKTSDNLVTLKGMIGGGTSTAGTTLLNLPAGFRPKETYSFPTVSNSAFARANIDASGNVSIQAGSNTLFSLDGITFYAEQ